MKAGVILRTAAKADIAAIITLLREDVLGQSREGHPDDPLYGAAFEAMMRNPDNRLYVLDEGGTIIGCAQLTIIAGLSRKGSIRAIIEAVRIAKDRRGSGLGEELIRELIRLAKQDGATLVQLTSDKSRHDAHRFYERLGFEKSHEGFKMTL